MDSPTDTETVYYRALTLGGGRRVPATYDEPLGDVIGYSIPGDEQWERESGGTCDDCG